MPEAEAKTCIDDQTNMKWVEAVTDRMRQNDWWSGTPTVLINGIDKAGLAPSLVPAHAAGAEAATAHLIAAGHERIGFIVGEPWMPASRERLNGYRAALRRAGIRYDPKLVRHGDGLVSGSHDQAADLMRSPRPPTAIFCASDRMALGAYEACKEMGLAIPRDVSIVGFDDDPLARYLEPPLTTVRVPHDEMGRRAVADLVARSRGDAEGRIPGQLRLECPLVVRASVGGRPQAAIAHPAPAGNTGTGSITTDQDQA